MFRKTLHVALFGISDALAAALEHIEPLDRFFHEFESRDAFDESAFLSADIVIAAEDLLDFSALPAFVEERRRRHEGSFSALVVLADAAEIASWTPECYAPLDAVWIAPLDETRAAFEFGRLQREARLASELRLARTYLDTTIDSTPELIWFKDVRGAHLKVNDAFCATVEKTKEQVEGRGHYYIWDITPEEYATGEYVCLESEDETIEAGRTCLFDEQVKTTRGMRQFKTYKSPLFDEDGSVMGTVGVAHDVTDLGNIATELEIFIDSMPFAIVVLDTDELVVNMNAKSEEYFDIRRADTLGRDFDEVRREVLGNPVVESNDFQDGSLFSAAINGTNKTFAVNDRTILDVFGNRTGHLRIYRDVTVERELEQRAILSARTDYLTGLYNRRYFYEYLEERGRDEALALVVLDLDDFKNINDVHGHALGDEALIRAGSLLRASFPDGVAIRWGGDEFIVALFGALEPSELRRRSEELLARFAAESRADGREPALTASIGIAATDDPALSIDELIKRGDKALYQAKRTGKSRCCAYGEGLAV